MKAMKFRERSVEELETEEMNLKEKIFKLRFQLASGHSENPMRIRQSRRDLARVKTILKEKRRGSVPSGPDEGRGSGIGPDG